MTELVVELGVLMAVLALLVCGLAAWRIGRVVSWRALATTAWATRSFIACVAFLRFCVEERELTTGNGLRSREVRSQSGSRNLFEEWPRVS